MLVGVEEYTTDSGFERCWEGGDAQVSIIVLDNNQDYTYTYTTTTVGILRWLHLDDVKEC